MSIRQISGLSGAVMLAACAGRSPEPVSIIQAQDQTIGCAAITAEVEANNLRITELAAEHGQKVAQNVVAGVAGVFIPVLWLAMDFQGAATTEQTALEQRNAYLGTLAQQRCASPGAVAQAR